MARSLQAQVRDPLWMLTRQWQVGEFQGEDAGSPVQAVLNVESQPLTTYQPGFDPMAAVPLDTILPVEVHVEREPVRLSLRGTVQLGLAFESMIRAAGLAQTIVKAFRNAYPVASPVPDAEIPDAIGQQFRTLVAKRITDGSALYQAIKQTQAGQVPAQPLPLEAQSLEVPQILQDFVSYRDSLYSEPSHDSAWQPQQLDYAFSLDSQVPNNPITLAAPAFPGGHLDWYDFSLAHNTFPTQGTATPHVDTWNFLPNHVTFRGMPNVRWWNFEDAQTDFGQLDPDHVDLAKMIVMEFALIYGNDWFEVPVPTQVGSLSRITLLVVTDTFGQRTVIRPTEAQNNTRKTPWSMFKVSGGMTHADFLLLAPTLGIVNDAPVLDDVLFLRDEMAAMAWAVEHKLQGARDGAIDGYESYRKRIADDPPPGARKAVPGGPEIYYLLETTVPDNWIPMVPIQAPDRARYFRRGTMERPTANGFTDIKARSAILEPDRPFFVRDQAIPRAGTEVSRYFRRTRWSDGSTYTWLGRKNRRGRGPGWSGLAFDVIEATDQAAPQVPGEHP